MQIGLSDADIVWQEIQARFIFGIAFYSFQMSTFIQKGQNHNANLFQNQ